MKPVIRNLDPIVEKKLNNFKTLLYIKDFPIYFGTTKDNNPKNDKCIDQKWIINLDTGNIFLKKLVPVKELYTGKQHSAGTVGSLWLEHHKVFAKFIRKFSPKSIFEIGGAHGLLSLAYSKYKKIDWTILEPDPNPAKGVQAKYIKGFIEEYKKPINVNSTIVHSHVFEHIYKPAEFIKKISKKMKFGQKMIFSVPNISQMIQRKYTNGLNFEHTIFLNKENIAYLLKKESLRIIEIKKFLKDHSIFYCVEKIDFIEKAPKFKINIAYHRQFNNFVNYHFSLVNQLNNKIEKHENKNIFLFGGHIFSQFLLKIGLKEDKIIYILDNDPKKNNQRLYGTNTKVKKPKILNKYKNPLIILKAGVYNDEIKRGILKINSKVKFI